MMEIKQLYSLYKECTGVNTDTRTIAEGQMFFALKGESFDGNEFALKALESGARYAVVDRASLLDRLYESTPQLLPEQEFVPSEKPHTIDQRDLRERVILVEDVLTTLQQLASYHRQQFDIPLLAVTGTNGKTTTKELITAVLSARYNVVATKGNLNNHIGVPLTLFRINEETQFAVIEMGASAPGEIDTLVKIARPTCGLVTNVGKAHLQGFGSFEGVKKTKGEMYDYLIANGGNIFYNADNENLVQMLEQRGVCRSKADDSTDPCAVTTAPYGLNYSASRVLPVSAQEPFLSLDYSCEEGVFYRINTKLIGSYNADNAVSALAVGRYFNVPLEEAAAAIESYIPSNNRSQMVLTAENTLIIDAYNANPTSMRAALDNFATSHFKNKTLILGDMLELGTDSAAEHKEVLELAFKVVSAQETGEESSIFLVGKEFASASQTAQKDRGEALFFNTSVELRDHLETYPLKHRTILIKGSRGTKLETIIPAL